MRQVEACLAGVALTAGTAAELIVDPAGLVALRADDEQAAGLADTLRPPRRSTSGLCAAVGMLVCLARGKDLGVVRLGKGVGTLRSARPTVPALRRSFFAIYSALPPSMISVPRPAMFVAMVTAPRLAGLRDDLGLSLVMLGVQHGVRHALALEHLREKLRLFDGDGADQHRLALFVAFPDLLDDGAVLAGLGLVDDVRVDRCG